MRASTKPPKPYGSSNRGVSAADVERAADQLLRNGQRPTVEKIRASLGTGSPNTINPLLDSWWKHVANRLDAGPAALHRLPEAVAHVAESLWMHALEEARCRALIELNSDKRAIDQAKVGYEVRSHVLSLREGELDSRLRERKRAYAELEEQLRTLTTLLKKEQKTRESQATRVAELETMLVRARRGRPLRVQQAPEKQKVMRTVTKYVKPQPVIKKKLPRRFTRSKTHRRR